jgi:hypothetical protein
MSTTVAISDRDGAMPRTLKSFCHPLIRVISHAANEAIMSRRVLHITQRAIIGDNQVKVLYAGKARMVTFPGICRNYALGARIPDALVLFMASIKPQGVENVEICTSAQRAVQPALKAGSGTTRLPKSISLNHIYTTLQRTSLSRSRSNGYLKA